MGAGAQTRPNRPPAWLVIATGALAVTIVVLAVAETNLWAHYLIDRGEFLALFGLGFILLAGFQVYRERRLFVSLPLVFPWLLYPVVTQGDQIIDNLSINPMRAVCQVLLAAIFAAPVAVIVLAARHLLAPKPEQAPARRVWTALIPGLQPIRRGQIREGTGMLAAALFAAEIWIGHQFLGTLMVLTSIVLVVLSLAYASVAEPAQPRDREAIRDRRERLALIVLIVGVVAAAGLYFGYKNRPGAYQGSPSAFMDPAQKDKTYPLDRIVVPAKAPTKPSDPALVQSALIGYARTLERLLAGYHILDRNYTYDFHNRLFLRATPLITNYRSLGLKLIDEARTLRAEADDQAAAARAALANDEPLAALLDELRDYVDFNFNRAPILERMSGEFERTEAGLQHAAHLYEGESKALGTGLAAILRKHQAVLESPATAPVTQECAEICRGIYQAYAHHVVGF